MIFIFGKVNEVSALHLAVIYGNIKIVKLLLNHKGININICDQVYYRS